LRTCSGFPKDAGHPIFIIADNVKYHHNKKVREFLNKKEQQGSIMMAFLPPYSDSPKLNPDEQVWNYAKREVSKRIIHSKEKIEKVIFSVMNTVQKNAQLTRSFLRMPDTEYAL
jgi:transposase